MSTREVRAKLADAVNDAIAGRTTYITQHGRRVAAIVPLSVADPPAGPASAETERTAEPRTEHRAPSAVRTVARPEFRPVPKPSQKDKQ